MNEPLHPAQVRAFEKLKGLRVGALYIERQDGKLRTVLELACHRLNRGKVDGVLWLCTRRRVELLRSGIACHAPREATRIHVVGIESLSHNLKLFLLLQKLVRRERMMLIIDNGLLIKNGDAIRTQRVIALSGECPYRLLISDVPFVRNVADMFTQWYALDWRILGYRTFWGFCINHVGAGNRILNGDYLLRAIAPYCAQILRQDVQVVAGRREYVWKFSLPEAAMREYRRVVDLFLLKAQLTTTGVYRMLQACQHVVCGRSIVEDFPLETAAMYASPWENPRIQALMEVLEQIGGRRVIVLYRYGHERENILLALRRRYGAESVGSYPETASARFTVMNVFIDERETARLSADVLVYYSSDWNWQKREEKELQCCAALGGGALTVVSLAAADTIDIRILESIWNKDNLIRSLRKALARRQAAGNSNAKDL